MTRKAFGLAVLSVYLCVAALPAAALPPSRQGPVDPRTGRYHLTGMKAPVFPGELLQPRTSVPRGKFPYSSKALAAARAAGRPLAIDPAPGGTVRPLIVLIDFSDMTRTRTPSDFVPLFFDNASTAWSVANYWKEVSYGQFTVTGGAADIIGWIRPIPIGQTPTQPGEFNSAISSYSQITDPVSGVNLTNLRSLIGAIVGYLDSTTNFADYASAGVVQSLILVHAGTGQEDSNDNTALYSHHAAVGPLIADGVEVRDYITVPELLSFVPTTGAQTPSLITPGVIVHEMGHLLGLPDLYPVSGAEGQTGTFSGVGVFDLMGFGMWGSNVLDRPDNPAHLSAWSKEKLGWLTPTLRTQSTGRTLRPVERFADADKVYSNTSADLGQYFLVENRQVTSTLGTWLFDKFLLDPAGGAAGVLVWQVDDNVIRANPKNVNDNSALRGLYVKEADGIPDMALTIPPGTPSAVARYFGLEADYFNGNLSGGQSREFTRTLPNATVNSSPVISTDHPDDFGTEVRMYSFARILTGEMDYILDIAVGGGTGALWKTFNDNSTERYPLDNTVPVTPEPMRSNDIVSLAFDSGNNVWMGSRDKGIFRFLGTRFDFLRQQEGLPAPGAGAPAGATAAPIQAMAFESATGSMWVGTDRGLFKMRDSGAGFRVQSSFTSASPSPQTLPPPLDNVHGMAIHRGTDAKYLATSGGLVLVVDGLTDGSADDSAGLVGTSFGAESIAIDDNGNDDPKDDILWIGASNGVLYRTDGKLPTSKIDTFPLPLKAYTLLDNSAGLKVTALSVDKKGRLWIGTEGRGIQLFDLREPDPNLRDPLNFKGAAPPRPEEEAYLNFNQVADNNGVLASNNVTGIGFEASTLGEVVAWIGHRADSLFLGGVSRFDANATDDNTTTGRDERLRHYSPIPPNDFPTTFGRSTSVSAVAGDNNGNVWFATTDRGTVRYGNAGVISLDRSNYVNVSAIATVTLQDDGLNSDPAVRETAVVRVTSTSDATGLLLTLTETGPDTGVFSATFGFTNGATDRAAKLIFVASSDTLTVKYVDFNPPGLRTATATWKRVFPFDDSWIIDNFSCFIATAAYGSSMAPEVDVFRRFRDRYLLTNAAGQMLVDLYYITSPPLANLISGSAWLRAGARSVLAPALVLSKFVVYARPWERAVVLLLIVLGWAGWMISGHRRNGSPR